MPKRKTVRRNKRTTKRLKRNVRRNKKKSRHTNKTASGLRYSWNEGLSYKPGTFRKGLRKYFFNQFEEKEDERQERKREEAMEKYNKTPAELTSAERVRRDFMIRKKMLKRQRAHEGVRGALAHNHPSALLTEDERRELGIY